MAYHYTDSGLDNVYLENGYTIHKTPYGDGVSIQNTEGLHRAIGKSIISRSVRMNGAELRFLRLEMELTQKCLAERIDADEQALRRWESKRKNPIQGPADRLLRAIYGEHINGDGSVRRMIQRLAELDTVERTFIWLKETKEGWRDTASC